MDMLGSGDPVPAGEYCFSVDFQLGDVAGEGAGGGTDNFLEMLNGYHSTLLYYRGDLFELVRRGGGNTDLSPPQLPEVLPETPSEEEMAAWLYPIVRGEEFVSDHPGRNGDVAAGIIAASHQQVPVKESSKQMMEKVRVRDAKQKCGERRRCKVNERFRTLRQLVPGCEKSNQASTLDRTIQYMKSLQQQVHLMLSVGGSSMIPLAAVYPVAPPTYSIQRPDGVVAAQQSVPPPVSGTGDIDPTKMVPFARPPMLLPLLHHAAVMTPAAPLIHQAPATTLNTRPDAGKSRSLLHSKKSRSLRHKDE
ncbi:hypothetical protein ACQ4PT_053325 [Festuca glaucescens]